MFEAFISSACKRGIECFTPVHGWYQEDHSCIKRRGPRILPWGTPDATGSN